MSNGKKGVGLSILIEQIFVKDSQITIKHSEAKDICLTLSPEMFMPVVQNLINFETLPPALVQRTLKMIYDSLIHGQPFDAGRFAPGCLAQTDFLFAETGQFIDSQPGLAIGTLPHTQRCIDPCIVQVTKFIDGTFEITLYAFHVFSPFSINEFLLDCGIALSNADLRFVAFVVVLVNIFYYSQARMAIGTLKHTQ